MSISTIPPELVTHIFAFLTPSTLPLSVSRDFHSAGSSDRLWWEFFFRRWPRRKLRDGRIPVGRYSPDSWRSRFLEKLCPGPIEIFVDPVPPPDPLSGDLVPSPGSSESEISEDEESPFLKRCYYAGYGRAMAEEAKRPRRSLH